MGRSPAESAMGGFRIEPGVSGSGRDSATASHPDHESSYTTRVDFAGSSSLARDGSSNSSTHNRELTAGMVPSIRKRGDHNRPTNDEARSSADESVPIISHAQTPPQNYNSISPSTRVGRQDGVAGVVGREHEHQQREEAERQAAHQEQREKGWWRSFVEKYGSVELENKGSVARDHLALERTFLAWLRTSLSFASIGIAITQLFRLNTTISKKALSESSATSPQARLRHVGKPLGATFIGISILILFIGFHRYFEAQHYVIRGKFPASRGSVLVVSFVAGALVVASLIVILAVAPGAFEG